MRASFLRLDGQKCAGANMKRDLVQRDPTRPQAIEQGHGVKCKPAVGAATEPSSCANIV